MPRAIPTVCEHCTAFHWLILVSRPKYEILSRLWPKFNRLILGPVTHHD